MIIKTDNLVKIYNERHVVDGVSIEVEQGTVVGLLGPNGAGKTTTFYMIVGIETPNSGSVTLDGRDISRLPMYERARAGIVQPFISGVSSVQEGSLLQVQLYL